MSIFRQSESFLLSREHETRIETDQLVERSLVLGAILSVCLLVTSINSAFQRLELHRSRALIDVLIKNNGVKKKIWTWM